MNKEFFRGMKEQIEPDEEQVEELKNKLKNTAAVSRKPMWIGGVCAAALCVAVGAGLFLSDSKTDKNSIKTSGSSSVQYNDSWSPDLINRNGNGSDENQTVAGGEQRKALPTVHTIRRSTTARRTIRPIQTTIWVEIRT